MKLERFQKRLNGWGIALVIWMAYLQTVEVFLVMKLTGTWDWSWWWITSPLWLPWLAFMAVLLLIVFVAIVIHAVVAAMGRSKQKKVIERFPGIEEEIEADKSPPRGGMVH